MTNCPDKKQVSVDCNCVCHSLPQKGCSFCSCKYGCIPAKTEINTSNEIYQLASTGLTVQVPQEQYERLKRLDENVKREIKKRRDTIKTGAWTGYVQETLKVLESLDK
jgi:hypothetical protein